MIVSCRLVSRELMARVRDGMLTRINGQKESPCYTGSELPRIIVDETEVRFAIVMSGWPPGAFPEVTIPRTLQSA
jgi:hypothetical protein